MDDRLHATTAANVAAILAGAHILRTHDVRPAVEAAAVADQILAAL
jgi:dihydropteroate synthase